MYEIIIFLNYYYSTINFSVALRKNEQTIVSGISDIGGHNPVFQSTMLPLIVGDVVQLQVYLLTSVSAIHTVLK